MPGREAADALLDEIGTWKFLVVGHAGTPTPEHEREKARTVEE
jgi:hypothetical protein